MENLMITSAELEYKPGDLVECAFTGVAFTIPKNPEFYMYGKDMKVRGDLPFIYNSVEDCWAKKLKDEAEVVKFPPFRYC